MKEGKDYEVISLAIKEAVLGVESPEIRAKILRLWAQTLRTVRVDVFPEAAHIEDVIDWLESVVKAL